MSVGLYAVAVYACRNMHAQLMVPAMCSLYTCDAHSYTRTVFVRSFVRSLTGSARLCYTFEARSKPKRVWKRKRATMITMMMKSLWERPKRRVQFHQSSESCPRQLLLARLWLTSQCVFAFETRTTCMRRRSVFSKLIQYTIFPTISTTKLSQVFQIRYNTPVFCLHYYHCIRE